MQEILYLNIYEKLFWLILMWLQLPLILTIFPKLKNKCKIFLEKSSISENAQIPQGPKLEARTLMHILPVFLL